MSDWPSQEEIQRMWRQIVSQHEETHTSIKKFYDDFVKRREISPAEPFVVGHMYKLKSDDTEKNANAVAEVENENPSQESSVTLTSSKLDVSEEQFCDSFNDGTKLTPDGEAGNKPNTKKNKKSRIHIFDLLTANTEKNANAVAEVENENPSQDSSVTLTSSEMSSLLDLSEEQFCDSFNDGTKLTPDGEAGNKPNIKKNKKSRKRIFDFCENRDVAFEKINEKGASGGSSHAPPKNEGLSEPDNLGEKANEGKSAPDGEGLSQSDDTEKNANAVAEVENENPSQDSSVTLTSSEMSSLLDLSEEQFCDSFNDGTKLTPDGEARNKPNTKKNKKSRKRIFDFCENRDVAFEKINEKGASGGSSHAPPKNEGSSEPDNLGEKVNEGKSAPDGEGLSQSDDTEKNANAVAEVENENPSQDSSVTLTSSEMSSLLDLSEEQFCESFNDGTKLTPDGEAGNKPNTKKNKKSRKRIFDFCENRDVAFEKINEKGASGGSSHAPPKNEGSSEPDNLGEKVNEGKSAPDGEGLSQSDDTEKNANAVAEVENENPSQDSSVTLTSSEISDLSEFFEFCDSFTDGTKLTPDGEAGNNKDKKSRIHIFDLWAEN